MAQAGSPPGRECSGRSTSWYCLPLPSSFMLSFLFYADWTDLRGAFSAVPTVTELSRGTAAAHATKRKVAGTAAKALQKLPPLPLGQVSASGMITYTVKGPKSGITGRVVVQLPPGYTDPG